MGREVYDKQFFDQQAEGSLSSARIVLPILFEYYKPKSVIDVGCERGAWLKAAAECGVQEVLGIEGAFVDRGTLFIDKQNFQACNLLERIKFSKRFDLAISVEVVEHLPYYRAETFVADLVKLSDYVLFSAALPYQGGTDHVNEQWLEFWAILFRRHRYVPCDLFRSPLYGNKKVGFRYTQNLVLFSKEEPARELFPMETIATDRSLSFPHPHTFLVNVTRYLPLSSPALEFEMQDYQSLLETYLSGETVLPLLKVLGARGHEGTDVDLFPDARTRIVNIQEELAARNQEIQRQSAELTVRNQEIERLSAEVAMRDEELERQAAELTARDKTIASQSSELHARDATIASLSTELADRNAQLHAMWSSRSWRMTAGFRWLAAGVRRPRHILRSLRSAGLSGIAAKVRTKLVLRRHAGLIEQSGLFDRNYYLQQNPDVAKAGIDPLAHYFSRGAYEGRDPHPLFDSSYYLRQNRDVAEAKINPLLHYLVNGAYEGRDPHPHFDSSYYLEQNPDVAEARLNPLAHYIGPGIAEGRDPNPEFDTSAYLEQNPEVALKGLNPLAHHLGARFRAAPSYSPILPASREANSSGFNLRAALRNEFEESGRVLLDSEHDSYPLVSVVIPCFNQGHFLEDAVLSSLLACSYPLEIIVVDDGSTDKESIRLIDELREKYKFTLVRQANKGRAGARNTGIERARGKYIQLLDGDDMLAPDKIDIQVDEFRAAPETGICVCEYEFCDGDGLNREVVHPSTIAGFSLSRENFLLRWERGLSIPIHCALFRRELLEKTKFQMVTVSAHEDWMFWVELSSHSPKFRFNPAVLATYRIHGRNTVTMREVMGLDFLRACLHISNTGLNNCEEFVQASIRHFQTAYLGSIKHEAIEWHRTHQEG